MKHPKVIMSQSLGSKIIGKTFQIYILEQPHVLAKTEVLFKNHILYEKVSLVKDYYGPSLRDLYRPQLWRSHHNAIAILC